MADLGANHQSPEFDTQVPVYASAAHAAQRSSGISAVCTIKLQHTAMVCGDCRRSQTRSTERGIATEAKQVAPIVPPLPAHFQHYRQELGVQVYGSMGIAREDKVSRAAAVLRNYEFFGAPVVAIICIPQDLGLADLMSVGMYVQTLLPALTARGLGTCCEVSLAAYPHILRIELNIAPKLSIICGLAIGYTDPDFPTNHIHVDRAPVRNNVVILDS